MSSGSGLQKVSASITTERSEEPPRWSNEGNEPFAADRLAAVVEDVFAAGLWPVALEYLQANVLASHWSAGL